jgi:hypothetical protein
MPPQTSAVQMRLCRATRLSRDRLTACMCDGFRVSLRSPGVVGVTGVRPRLALLLYPLLLHSRWCYFDDHEMSSVPHGQQRDNRGHTVPGFATGHDGSRVCGEHAVAGLSAGDLYSTSCLRVRLRSSYPSGAAVPPACGFAADVRLRRRAAPPQRSNPNTASK